ncbi:MAG: hypothetical protein J7L51_00060 [Desulfurococcales archaeon]|nr:hypothetical protein [Desulfurococcales archaeon]
MKGVKRMHKKHLWELTPEEMKEHVLEYLHTTPKFQILKDLIEAGAILCDLHSQFLKEALQEIPNDDLRTMLAQLAENEARRIRK